jgi:hypothetical protein
MTTNSSRHAIADKRCSDAPQPAPAATALVHEAMSAELAGTSAPH